MFVPGIVYITIKVLIALPEQGVYNGFQLLFMPTPTCHYLHECQNSLIQCSTSSFVLCQFQFLEFTPLCYEQYKRFSIHRYSPSVLSVL